MPFRRHLGERSRGGRIRAHRPPIVAGILLTPGPDLSALTIATDSYTVEGGDFQGIAFSPDGLNMYIGDDASNGVLHYTLTIPFDVTTRGTRDFTWEPVDPFGVQSNDPWITPDGSRILLLSSDPDVVYWADLSVAFDLSTVGATSTEDILGAPGAITSGGVGMCFNADGTAMFITDSVSTRIIKSVLSTPYDPSTRAAPITVLDMSIEQSGGGGFGIDFSGDGTKFYSADLTTNFVHQYNTDVAYDLSVASHRIGEKTAAGTNPYGLFCRKDANEIYVTHNNANRVISSWT